MTKPRKCTRCRGHGKYLPENGFTRADMVQCRICKGSGVLPEGYVVNRNGLKWANKPYVTKTEGIEETKDIEEV